ncbi:MAG TPA: hemolysin family protein [Atopostipes sp.]|nr:hemolysin family protein [Atopostipes sp.]
MDGSQINSIIIFIVCVGFSAFFSSSETAYTSVSRIRLKHASEDGDRQAQKALNLQQNFESLLSTILIGNNLVNIAASSIATLFFINLFPTYGATIATVATTVILLLFGEITPKLIAKVYSEPVAKKVATPINLLMKIFTPFVWILSQWQKFIRRIIPLTSNELISEEELLSIVDEARLGGSIEKEEHKLVKAAIEFDDMDISAILTPRVDVIGFDINDTDAEIQALYVSSPFTRMVVYDEDVDNVVGTLHVKDFFRYLDAKENNLDKYNSIHDLLTKPLLVPPTIALSDLLTSMQEAFTHIAVVVDEFGGMIGIVTMEDVLEELVGEIWDESDVVRTDIRKLKEPDTYLIQGTYSIDKLFELFHIKTDEVWMSNTVNGFIIEQFEYIPENNEVLYYNDLKFTIVNALRQRVNEVVVERIPLSETGHEQE